MLDYIAIDFVTSLKAIRELYRLGQNAIGAGKRAQIHVVLRALRDVYFFEDLTFGLLDRLINQQDVSPTDLQRADEGFRGSEEDAFEALESLEQFVSAQRLDISIQAISGLRQIIFGKGGARIGIIEFFMDLENQISAGAFERNRLENAVRAQELKDVLVELNTRIQEVDEQLRSISN